MANGISVVINTYNEESNIKRAIESVSWADEILICDSYSEDKTVEIAKRLDAKVVSHKKVDYVELSRNFAISKASNDWILVLDPDEEIKESLKERLLQISSKMKEISFVRLPRKNIIFGKWMKASGWWPDYNIRFFKKGKVNWTDKIHKPPEVLGEGIDLEADEKWAIIHHHYKDILQFLERMIRYTSVQADELKKEGYTFDWKDLIKRPLAEFLGRFFANKGFKDGIHGLALSMLQAFSFFVVYLRIWEMEKFESQKIDLGEIKDLSKQTGNEINYWLKYGNLSKNPFKSFFQKIKNKV